MWFLLPFIVFIIEWTLRVTKSRFGERSLTYAEQGIILPSRVIQLIVKRPLYFDFHPGDYVYVQIPAITQYEWHPLTISSAPEQEGMHFTQSGSVVFSSKRSFGCISEQSANGLIGSTIISTIIRLIQ